MWRLDLFVWDTMTLPHSTSLIPPSPVSKIELGLWSIHPKFRLNITQRITNTRYEFEIWKECFYKIKRLVILIVCFANIWILKRVLTAYTTLSISKLPFKNHMARFLWMIKLKMHDWMAPKKFKIAVLEYWHGYLLPILACIRNHEDHIRLPTTKYIEPMAHLSLVAGINMPWFVMWGEACEWVLLKGIPL